MNVERMNELIAAGEIDAVESAWMQAVEQNAPIEVLAKVLAALVDAEHLDAAETMGWALLAERIEEHPGDPLAVLGVARAVVSAVPISDELRGQAAELYRQAHGRHERFEVLLKASGLLTGQSPRRAFRTLEVCLAIRPGGYVANRYDHAVFQVDGYNEAMGEFEVSDTLGRTKRFEPKLLADEFDAVDDSDFRVLASHRPDALRELLEADPAAVLIGLCMANDGRIDANELKERLTPTYVPADKWSGWWNRARTAAKRSEYLSIEGRSPIVVVYHPGGKSLEDEFAEPLASAKMPLDRLARLRQYVREAQSRRKPVQPAFVAEHVEALAQQAEQFADRRPADALAAALAVEALREMNLPAPSRTHPAPAEILAAAAEPAKAVAALDDPTLWPAALDALQTRPDAGDHLQKLLQAAPIARKDEVAVRLRRLGRGEALDAAVAAALANPAANLDICLWLWKGPAAEAGVSAGQVELLGKLLGVLGELERDWVGDPAVAKDIRQRIRSALAAENFAAFRAAAAQMDEAVAGTMKRTIERCEGLAVAVREEMLNVLRESFYQLFVQARVNPWEDPNAIWTTQAALNKREDELKYLVDVTMFENARAIGAAAEHGDLSENSEWQFAIQERDLLRARAAKMQDELQRARVIHRENVPTASVGVGSRVRAVRLSDGATLELSFLGPWDSDIDKGIYSYQTAMGQSLMGKRVGDEVTLKLGGSEEPYRIEGLSSAVE